MQGKDKEWVQLTSIYRQKILPANDTEIATARKLKYLDKLKLVMRVNDNKEVNLLIGQTVLVIQNQGR